MSSEADARTPDYAAHAPGLPGPLDSDAVEDVVAEHRLEIDQLGLLRQLGVAPGQPKA